MNVKMSALIVSMVLIAAGFVGNTEAATITLTGSQIDSFAFSAVSSSSNVFSASNNFNGFFDVDFDSTSPGAGLGVFELTGLSITYTAGGYLSLLFTNLNFSTWGFELVVTTDGGVFTSGVTASLQGFPVFCPPPWLRALRSQILRSRSRELYPTRATPSV